MFLDCSGRTWSRATSKRNLMQLVALHLPCKGECNRNHMSATKSEEIDLMNWRHERVDYTGRRFGALTATKDIGTTGRKRIWRLICDCGERIELASSEFAGGKVRSCGCHSRPRFYHRECFCNDRDCHYLHYDAWVFNGHSYDTEAEARDAAKAGLPATKPARAA